MNPLQLINKVTCISAALVKTVTIKPFQMGAIQCQLEHEQSLGKNLLIFGGRTTLSTAILQGVFQDSCYVLWFKNEKERSRWTAFVSCIPNPQKSRILTSLIY